MEIALEVEDITRVVLEHLRSRGHIATMRALERESGVEADILGDDATFLRSLVLDGRWEDAVILLEPLRGSSAVVYKKAVFEVRKQEFLEMLEDKAQGDNATALVKALHRLEEGCSGKEFDDLCCCLTLSAVRNHPGYLAWTPHLGRLWCFEALKQYLCLLFPGQEAVMGTVPGGQLELLCRQACLFQAEEARRQDPNLTFPSAVIGGLLSQTWNPKATTDVGTTVNENPHTRRAHASEASTNGERQDAGHETMRGNLLTGFHEQVLTQASSSARQQSRRSQSFRVSPVLDSIPSGPPSRGSEVSATRSLRSSEGTGVVVGDQEAGAAIVVAGAAVQHSHQQTVSSRRYQRPLDETLAHDSGGGESSVQRDLYGLIGGVSRGTGSSGGFSQKSPTNGDNSSVMYQGAISKTSAGERNVGKGTLLLSDGYHVNVNMSHDGEMVNNDENNMARGGGRTEEQEIEESQTRFTITSNGVHGDGGRATALRVFQDQRGGGMGNDQDGNSSKQSNNNNNQYGHNSDTSSRRENMFGPDTPTGSGSSLVAGEKAQDTNKRGMAEGIEGPSHGALLDPFGQLDPSSGTSGGVGEPFSSSPSMSASTVFRATKQFSKSPLKRKGPPPQPPVAWEITMGYATPVVTSSRGRVPMAALGDGGGGCGSVERRAVRGHSAEPVGRRRGHAGGAWSAVESEVRMAEQGFDAEEAAERGVEGVRGGREGAGGGPGWMFIRQRSRSSSPPPLCSQGKRNIGNSRRSHWPQDNRFGGNGGGGGGGSQPGDNRLCTWKLFPRPGGAGSDTQGLPASEASWKSREQPRNRCWGPPGALTDEDAVKFTPTVVMREMQPVRAVAFSPDGWLFAAGSNNRALRVCRAPMEEDLVEATEVVDEKGGLRVLPSREVLRRDALHRGSIYCLGFSPDSSLIATGLLQIAFLAKLPNNSIQLFEIVLKLLRAAVFVDLWRPTDSAADELSLARYCLQSLAGSNDKTVRLLQLPPLGIEMASPLRRNGFHEGESTTTEGLLLRGHTGTVRDLCFPWYPPPDNLIVAAKNEGKDKKGYPTAQPRTSSRLAVDAESAGRLLTVGAGDFVCRIWDVEGGVTAGVGGGDCGGGAGGGSSGGIAPLLLFRGHTATVFSCSMLPRGNVAITGGADAVVRMWDTRTGASICSLGMDAEEVLCVRPWPGEPERMIVTSHGNGSCFLWDLRTGRSLSSLFHHNDQTRSLDFSPDGQSLLTGSYDGLTGVIRCCDCGDGAKRPWNGLDASVAAGVGRSWEQPELSVLTTLRAHRGRVLQVCWRPTGRPAFLTSSTDCTVMLWSLPQPQVRE